MSVHAAGLKRWNSENEWTNRPPVSVALAVDEAAVVDLVCARLKL